MVRPFAIGKSPKIYGLPIEDTDFGMHVLNVCAYSQLYFVAEFALMPKARHHRIKYLGRKGREDLVYSLSRLNVCMGECTVDEVLLRPITTLKLRPSTLRAIVTNCRNKNPLMRDRETHREMSILALVLWSKQRLGLRWNQERAINAALEPLGLHLYMDVIDLFAERDYRPIILSILERHGRMACSEVEYWAVKDEHVPHDPRYDKSAFRIKEKDGDQITVWILSLVREGRVIKEKAAENDLDPSCFYFRLP